MVMVAYEENTTDYLNRELRRKVLETQLYSDTVDELQRRIKNGLVSEPQKFDATIYRLETQMIVAQAEITLIEAELTARGE